MTQVADSLVVEGGVTATGAITGSGGTQSGTTLVSPTISAGTLSGPTVINGGAVIHGFAELLAVPVSAVSAAATAFPLAVPVGGVVTNMQFATLTAFTGATVSAEVGSGSGDASYVAATSVKNGGIVTLSPVATAAAASALTAVTSGGLTLTLAQGTPTAVGSGNLLITYVVP